MNDQCFNIRKLQYVSNSIFRNFKLFIDAIDKLQNSCKLTWYSFKTAISKATRKPSQLRTSSFNVTGDETIFSTVFEFLGRFWNFTVLDQLSGRRDFSI